MRKGFFKFRVSRVIPTFQSCRSKDTSTLPTNPVPSFLHHHHHHSSTTATTVSAATTTSHKLNSVGTTTPSPRPKPHRFSLKSHVSSAFSSARRGCLKSRPSPEPSHTQSPHLSSPFKWHVIAKVPAAEYHDNYDSTPPRRKIYNSAASDTEHENDVVFLPPLPSKTRHKKIRRNRRRTTSTSTKPFQKVRISTSSDSGLFSDDDNDSQTLVSSDTPSPLSHHRHVITKSKEREKKKKMNSSKSSVSGRRSSVDLSGNTSPVPARLSEFMRKMAPCRTVANGKVRESFAMVKKSEEPYEDFKRSMAEMVVEKQMFEERELEELLRCFLSLNSEHHHEAIVRAFTEIWQGLFCQSSSLSNI